AWAFGWKDVVKMHRDGVADSLIIQKIEHSGKRFHLEAKQIHSLMEADVSDEVISAMLRTEDQYEPRDEYYGGYYGDDYYHSPRVYLGFDYYRPYSWYYGTYGPYYGTYGYTPRYYGGRYYGYGGYSHGYTPRYRSYERYGGHAYPDYGTSRTRTYVGPSTKGRRR
ncbi:MAG: hypothetical protein ACM3JJ_05990, partial [Hyphomicrobiales bacterium]